MRKYGEIFRSLCRSESCNISLIVIASKNPKWNLASYLLTNIPRSHLNRGLLGHVGLLLGGARVHLLLVVSSSEELTFYTGVYIMHFDHPPSTFKMFFFLFFPPKWSFFPFVYTPAFIWIRLSSPCSFNYGVGRRYSCSRHSITL